MQQDRQPRKGLKDKPIISDSPASLGLVKVTVCGVSGLLDTDACDLDTQYPAVTDWFLNGTEPTSVLQHTYGDECLQGFRVNRHAVLPARGRGAGLRAQSSPRIRSSRR